MGSALATERSDEALRAGVLPRRPRGNGDLTKVKSRDASPELRSTDRVAITDQVPRVRLFGKPRDPKANAPTSTLAVEDKELMAKGQGPLREVRLAPKREIEEK